MSLFPYTFQNHFRFGYRDSVTLETRWLDRRRSDDEVFVATYGRAQSSAPSWRASNTMAAHRILEKARRLGLKPVVCYSGGLDSEVCLVAFLEALQELSPEQRLPLEVATMVDARGLNQHDVAYVAKFRSAREAEWKRNGLSVSFQTYELNFEAFLKSESLPVIFEETQMLSPILNSHVLLFQKIFERSASSLPILGQGELYLSRNPKADEAAASGPSCWSVVETENLCGLFRFFIGRGRPAIPGFFQYLPEQFEAQLRTNPVLHELISNSRPGKLGTRTSKAEIIAFDYPELEARPKFTGFEKLETLHDEVREAYGRQHPALESKWSMEVMELMQCLTAQDAGPFRDGDWQFGWGQTSRVFTKRGSKDDFFATEWTSEIRPSPSGNDEDRLQNGRGNFPQNILSGFLNEARAFISDTTEVLHDGSLVARLFYALKASMPNHGSESAPVTLTDTRPEARPDTLSGAQIARLLMTHGHLDSDSLSLLILAKSQNTGESKLLIPRLPMRVVNTEYDRWLEATLVKPRFVWVESERLALVSRALPQVKYLKPWTSAALVSQLMKAVVSSGWMGADEPGPSSSKVVNDFFESALKELKESDQAKDIAKKNVATFQSLKQKVTDLLKDGHYPTPRHFTSARHVTSDHHLTSGRAATASGLNAKITLNQRKNNLPPVRFSDIAFHGRSLKAVDDSTWLEYARQSDPDIFLPSNLFFAQSVEGFLRLNENSRASFARTHQGVEVAWAHLCVLSPPPFGRLRIRGVNVRSDLRREGHATELIRSIAEASRTLLDFGFSGIDVFAAPEVTEAFLRAGFNEDVKRVSRKEESVDKDTGLLVATDRDLTPLSFEFSFAENEEILK